LVGCCWQKDLSATLRRRPGARGWRNFIGVPIENAQVRVDLDGRSHEIQADHSGIIDVVVDVDLEPGWHRIGLSSENSQVATGPGIYRRSADEVWGRVGH
jgi:phosphatidate phosphatase APP1